jgi:beta-N-acetylhexosaminidase
VEIWEQNRILQVKSKIPMLIAANIRGRRQRRLHRRDYVGWEVKIAATREPPVRLRTRPHLRSRGTRPSGCNWSFAPIVACTANWRNPIISQRTWSADVEQTIELSLEYLRGIQESGSPRRQALPPATASTSAISTSPRPQLAVHRGVGRHLREGLLGPLEAGLPRSWRPPSAHASYQKQLFKPRTWPWRGGRDPPRHPLPRRSSPTCCAASSGFKRTSWWLTDASHIGGGPSTGAMKRSELLPHPPSRPARSSCSSTTRVRGFRSGMMEGYRNGVLTEEQSPGGPRAHPRHQGGARPAT